MSLKFKIVLPIEPKRPSNIVNSVLKVKIDGKDLPDIEIPDDKTEISDAAFVGDVGDAVRVSFNYKDVVGTLFLVRAFDVTLADTVSPLTAGDMGLVILSSASASDGV